MTERAKLLFIAGDGRSGSTLLSRLLGQADHSMDVGEMLAYFYNKNAFPHNRFCGCGEPVANCPFWKDIVGVVKPEVQDFSTESVRVRSLWWLVASPFKSKALKDNLETLSMNISQLISAVSKRSNSNIVVDSSKTPPYLFLSTQVRDHDLYVLHLVKDPRDVVKSWVKPKAYLQKKGILRAVRDWLLFNLLTEWVSRVSKAHYLFVRYEDFVADPEQTLRKILDWVGAGPQPLSFLSGRTAQLSAQHVLGGNPDKFDSGAIEIKARPSSLPLHYEVIASALTLPLLHKYQYSLVRPK